MEESVFHIIEEMQRLTHDYANYARRRSGLGNVLGGMITLVVAILILLIKPDILIALVASGFTLVWLIGKELLRTFLYTPLGKATERWSAPMQWFHLLRMCLSILLLGGLSVSVVVHQHLAFQQWWPLLIFLLVIPWIVWRYLRSSMEYLLGLFLLLASVFASIDRIGDVRSYLFVALLLALLAILLGLDEHLRFRLLVGEILVRQRDVLYQRLLYPIGGLAKRTRSVQLSWLLLPSFQYVPRGVLPAVFLIGIGTLFSLIHAFAFQHPLSLSPLPIMVSVLLSLDEALHPCVVPAWSRQGVRR
ncbi:MAG: hypothetical protein ACYDER_03100 [Ktedonobacteraceae bacterium]